MGGAFIALALVSAQAGRADDKTVNLIVKPKVGTVTKYKTKIKTSVSGTDIAIEESEKHTVKEVKDNGDVVLVSESLGGTISVGGMEMPQPATPPVTTTRSKLGKLLEFKTDEQPGSPFTPEVTRLIASISELVLNDKDVKENDSWESELDNPASKENKVKVKTTYVGMEKVDDVDCWKIKQSSEAVVGMNAEKMSCEFTAWVNPKTGVIQKSEGKMTDVPCQIPNVDKISFEIVQTVDKGDTKKDDKDK